MEIVYEDPNNEWVDVVHQDPQFFIPGTFTVDSNGRKCTRIPHKAARNVFILAVRFAHYIKHLSNKEKCWTELASVMLAAATFCKIYNEEGVLEPMRTINYIEVTELILQAAQSVLIGDPPMLRRYQTIHRLCFNHSILEDGKIVPNRHSVAREFVKLLTRYPDGYFKKREEISATPLNYRTTVFSALLEDPDEAPKYIDLIKPDPNSPPASPYLIPL
jgi:hypothetical protein